MTGMSPAPSGPDGPPGSATVTVRGEATVRTVTDEALLWISLGDGPHWYVTPSNPARLEAAKLAAADARHRAQAYAEGAGAGLGALVRLVEPAMMPGPTSVSRRASAAGSDEMPTEAEDHEVHASIDATFELDISRRPRRTRQRPR